MLVAVACRTPSFPVDDALITTRARLLRIDDTRADEPAFLDSAIAGTTQGVDRGRAALTAGRLGATVHLPALRRLAAEGDTPEAARAVYALGLMKDSGSIALAARALRGEAATVVVPEAAWLLGEIGEPARPAIVRLLADSALSSTARGALLLASTRLKPVPTATVAPWVSSADSAVAWRAAYALSRGRSAAGVRTLAAAAYSPVGSVREQVARGMSRALTGDTLRSLALAALAPLVTDPLPHVRVNAIRALATHGRDGADRIVHALADGDPGVRLTAATALDAVLDSLPVRWQTAFAADTAFVVQRAVAEGARKHGVPIREVDWWRKSTEWQRRAATVELDAIAAARVALELLQPWMQDGDGRVRAAAAGAIATLVDSAATRATARARLRDALMDADIGVRAAALLGLAPTADAHDLALAIDSYARARDDRMNDARLAFWALADSALRRRPAPPDSIVAKLDAIGRPTETLDRLAAVHIPRFASWRDSTSPARSFDWYRDRARDAVTRPTRRARIDTDRGSIELELSSDHAPLTVYNFVSLAQRGYFDGQQFHRVVPNFVVQGGDPRGDGSGGPGYAIRDEMNPLRYVRGTLGMALSGPHTGGSQFFITHSPQPHLDGGYTVFGRMVGGGDVLDHIVQGDRIVRVTIQ